VAHYAQRTNSYYAIIVSSLGPLITIDARCDRLSGDWVDLSMNDLSVIGQFLLDSPTLEESEQVDDDLDDSEESASDFPQQVIHIDGSYAASNSSATVQAADAVPSSSPQDTERIQALEAENTELKTALSKAQDELAAAHAASQAAEVEREAASARAAAEATAAVAAQAEEKLAATKTKLEETEASAAAETAKHSARADAAEALVSALRHELDQCHQGAEAERALAVQEAVQKAVQDTKGAAMARQSMEVKALRVQVETQPTLLSALRQELSASQQAAAAANASYEELLKTMASGERSPRNNNNNDNDGSSGSSGSSSGMKRSTSEVALSTACREANRILQQYEGKEASDVTLSAVSSNAGAASANGGVEEEGEEEEFTNADAVVCVRQCVLALEKAHSTKIAIEDFKVGDVAMFFPIPKQPGCSQEYVAFSSRRSKIKHFLSEESKVCATFSDFFATTPKLHK